MSAAPPRRSTRQVRPPSRYEDNSAPKPKAKSKASRAPPNQAPQREFLSKLYSEIYDAATNPNPAEITAAQNILRLARVRSFWNTLPNARLNDYHLRITGYRPKLQPVRAALGPIQRDVRDIAGLEATRLNTFINNHGYVFLSICAHSRAFRGALQATDGTDSLTWAQEIGEIANNVASLELFARTRGLDWRTPLHAHDNDFRVILRRVLTKQLSNDSMGGLASRDFGINANQLIQIHRNIDHVNPHTLFLTDNATNAGTCSVTYIVSKDLAKDSHDTNPVGENETVDQEEIADSVLLNGYTWPYIGNWPEQDPRYAGFDNEACAVCGQTNNLIPEQSKGIPAPNTYQRCGHTYEDLQKQLGTKTTPLIELITTARTGTGVRSLQKIEQGQYLGSYVGEMYPYQKGNAQNPHEARYLGEEGASYRLTQDISVRHPKKRKATTVNGNSSKKRRLADDDVVVDAAPLHLTEYHSFVIDPAVHGNWTRYINHNCDNNTTFERRNVGQRTLVLVEATRRIEFGEEITIDYGDHYFSRMSFACRCGFENCVKWDETNKDGNTVTLRKAIQNETAPAWATTAGFVMSAIPTPLPKGKGNRGGKVKGK